MEYVFLEDIIVQRQWPSVLASQRSDENMCVSYNLNGRILFD